MESLKLVLGRRDKILAAVSHPVAATHGKPIDGAALGRMTEAALGALPKDCRYSAVFKTFSPLLGTIPTPDILRAFSWAAAANTDLLREDVAVTPRRLNPTPTEATVQFIAVRRLPGRKTEVSTKKRIRVRFRVLVGPGTPGEFETTWEAGFMAFTATHPDGLGFSGRANSKGKSYQHYLTYVGLRAILQLSYSEGRVVVGDLRCTESLRDYNREVTEMRWRHHPSFACPFDFEHTCHVCPKGQNSCKVACRPLDLIQIGCKTCKTTADADPYWNPEPEQCVRCSAGITGVKKGVPKP